MRKYSNEIVLIIGIITAYILILLVKQLQFYSLWGSLVALVFVAGYYSITFFNSRSPYQKLFYYLLMLPLIIGYFSLVYYSFGIVDTSNGEVIKEDWINSFYFSVVTWTTLGYGDLKPVPDLKPWVMVEALMGYIYMGLLVGKILYIATSINKSKT